MPGAPNCPQGPRRVLLRVGGGLAPGVVRTPKTVPAVQADPVYQEGLRRAEAARKRRAEMNKASNRRRKEEDSVPTKPVLAPQSSGAAKRRPASRGPGGWRGPERNWKCSRYDPPSSVP